MVNNVIEVRGLTVVRDRPVLDGLDVTIGSGVTGLLGPSGCGKSTLLRSIVGVQQVAGGECACWASPPAAHRCAGGSATSPRSPASTTTSPSPRTCASSPACSAARTPRWTRRSTRSTSASTRDAQVGRLSGGQRSRASLAVALLGSPDLLVLDEPTVGLDPVLRRDLWLLFHRLADDGAAVLVSSHVMDEAERCDQLLLMREGAILAQDTPAAIKERAGTDDVESAFLKLVEDVAA